MAIEDVAASYADALSAQMTNGAERGEPFGFLNEVTGSWADSQEDIPGHIPGEELPPNWRVYDALDVIYTADDIRYLVGADGDLLAAYIVVNDSPHAVIDLEEGCVNVSFRSHFASRPIPDDVRDALLEAAEGTYQDAAHRSMKCQECHRYIAGGHKLDCSERQTAE